MKFFNDETRICEDCDLGRSDCSKCGPYRKHDCLGPSSCKNGYVWDSKIDLSRSNFCKKDCTNLRYWNLPVENTYYTRLVVETSKPADSYQRVKGYQVTQICGKCDPSCNNCFGPTVNDCIDCKNPYELRLTSGITDPFFGAENYLSDEWNFDLVGKGVSWTQKADTCQKKKLHTIPDLKFSIETELELNFLKLLNQELTKLDNGQDLTTQGANLFEILKTAKPMSHENQLIFLDPATSDADGDRLSINHIQGHWASTATVKIVFGGILLVDGNEFTLVNCQIDAKGHVQLFGHRTSDINLELPWRYFGGFLLASDNSLSFQFVERSFVLDLSRLSMTVEMTDPDTDAVYNEEVLWVKGVANAFVGTLKISESADHKIKANNEPYGEIVPVFGFSDETVTKFIMFPPDLIENRNNKLYSIGDEQTLCCECPQTKKVYRVKKK